MTRLALIFALTISLAATAYGGTGGAPLDDKPIPFDKKSAVSQRDVKLASALAMEPVMTRGLIVDAPVKTVEYMMNRPLFTSRLMTEYGMVSGELEKEEDGAGWTFTGGSGARYVFRPANAGKSVHFIRFSFFHSSQLGVGLKISGVGAVVFRVAQGKDTESTAIDYDVYLIEGERPLDKVAGRLSAQLSEAVSDFSALADAFGAMAEAIHEDAESVADEIRDADETFTKKDVETFEKDMGVKRRGRAR